MNNNYDANWVVVVDDDLSNLKIAGFILSQKGIRVTALQSGTMLKEHISPENCPDLLLLDILMPDMDGFEVLKEMREYEKENNLPELPVVFLTGTEDKEIEAKGFELGAVDFIRKPFEPDVLLGRIRNVLKNSQKIHNLSEEASIDKLTGILNKGSVTTKLEKICPFSTGALMIIDLDKFKLINDIYGHDAGDKILAGFAELMRHHFRANDIIGRIGGDEFIAFLMNGKEHEAIKGISSRLASKLHSMALDILGKDMTIPFGMSVGAVITPGGESYQELFSKADKSLYHVKQNGKGGCFIYDERQKVVTFADKQTEDMRKLNIMLSERHADESALFLGQESFVSIYRYLLRFLHRYHEDAYKLLLTVMPKKYEVVESDFNNVMEKIGESLKTTLRNCDIITKSSENQFFLLLPMVDDSTIDIVLGRVNKCFEASGYLIDNDISCEKEPLINSNLVDGWHGIVNG
ncbi:MAG: diguanylate cyclase [Butyrivibrio sp.]|nr:diguanylate cyclase [Butyrivibrio sp.]